MRILFVIAVVACVCKCTALPATRLANYRVSIGMSRAEVYKLLGRSHSADCSGFALQAIESWQDLDGMANPVCVTVTFGGDGTVTSVVDLRPTVVDPPLFDAAIAYDIEKAPQPFRLGLSLER